MYIDDMGGLWLAEPGGVVLALVALGLVLWAQAGLRVTRLSWLVGRRRVAGAGRRGAARVRRPGYGVVRSSGGSLRVAGGTLAAPTRLPVAVPVRLAEGRAVSRRRSRDDREVDLLPVA
jgi:hypothetical protein